MPLSMLYSLSPYSLSSADEDSSSLLDSSREGLLKASGMCPSLLNSFTSPAVSNRSILSVTLSAPSTTGISAAITRAPRRSHNVPRKRGGNTASVSSPEANCTCTIPFPRISTTRQICGWFAAAGSKSGISSKYSRVNRCPLPITAPGKRPVWKKCMNH